MTRDEAAVLIGFHVWADRRVLAAVARLGPSRFGSAPIPGAASLRDMLVKQMNGDVLWLSRWQERPRTLPFLAPAFSDPEMVALTWSPVQASLVGAAEALTDGLLVRTITYRTNSGKDVNRRLWQLVLQLVERGAAGRALVLAGLRACGGRALHVDLGHFLGGGEVRRPC